jgi:LysR family transcriptional regulator for bpeEF and oprC
MLPLMKALLDRYPEMSIDLQISDRIIDLIEEGVDLAIRIGRTQGQRTQGAPRPHQRAGLRRQ